MKHFTSLETFINEDGWVDYEAILQDPEATRLIDADMDKIALTDLNAIETVDGQLAFLVNSYNMAVVKSVLEQMQKNSSWSGNMTWNQRMTFFSHQTHIIAKQKINLNQLEASIRQFGDPRVHMVLNYGSRSCPRMMQTWLDPDLLNTQLQMAVIAFVNNHGGVQVVEGGRRVLLSMIFSWYSSDFGGEYGVKTFLMKYFDDKEVWLHDPKVEYQYCDWRLNSQKIEE